MTRLDPYQQRARELCIADGVDPDSRVGEGRGRPAWSVHIIGTGSYLDLSVIPPISDNTPRPERGEGNNGR